MIQQASVVNVTVQKTVPDEGLLINCWMLRHESPQGSFTTMV